MLLLGLLLVIGAAVFTGLVIEENYSGGPDHAVGLFGNHIATLDGLGIFLAGIALALVFCLGLAMLGGGTVRHRRRRMGLRGARREAARAAAERDALAARLDETDGAGRGTGTGETPGAGQDTAATPATARRHRGRHIFGH